MYTPSSWTPGQPVPRELVFGKLSGTWLAAVVEHGIFTQQDAAGLLRHLGYRTVGEAARALLDADQLAAEHATIKLPGTGQTADEIAEWVRQYKALFGEVPDSRDSVASAPARYCHIDGHVWVDTGMLRSWCRWCDEEGQWSREHGEYRAAHRVARRYDA